MTLFLKWVAKVFTSLRGYCLVPRGRVRFSVALPFSSDDSVAERAAFAGGWSSSSDEAKVLRSRFLSQRTGESLSSAAIWRPSRVSMIFDQLDLAANVVQREIAPKARQSRSCATSMASRSTKPYSGRFIDPRWCWTRSERGESERVSEGVKRASEGLSE